MPETTTQTTSHNAPSGDRPLTRYPVSVIVLTYNEAVNIGPCLESLHWADDVIVLDSFSSDGTLQAATAARSDVRTFQNRFEDFGQQRNWALDNTGPRHEWILFLDADERTNPDCIAGLKRAMESGEPHAGYYLTCLNHFLGRPIPRCTMYPSWQLRLLRQGQVRYRKEGHGQREVTDGSLGYVREPYDHYGFSKGIAHWIDRHNAYSTNEVELIHRLRREPLALRDLFRRDSIQRRRCLKRLAARVGFRPLFRFLYMYFVRMGFLEGRAGLIFCLLRVAQEIHITAKLAEAEQQPAPAPAETNDVSRHA